MADEIDELTLARARRGDATALSALVRHYQRPVYALVARLMVGRGAAVRDDVAQEVFIRVCRGVPRFDPAEKPRLSTWILTVATRACLNAIRDGRRQPGDLLARDDVAADDPEKVAADRQLRRRVEAAMGALPDDMRAVLVLRAYHDFDYEEIAAAVGVEIGTVKSRMARARAALREALTEETSLEGP